MVQNLHINKDEFTEEVVNRLIKDNNITIKLTAKRKRLLAVLLYLNGLDNKDEQGRFFIDNLWLSQFVEITETNLLVALRYFQLNGVIERESGSNHNCSRYRIINSENNSTNQKTVVQNNSIDDKNNSRDRDIELDIEKDIYNIIINKINNIIKENNNNLINIIEEKENNIINNIIKEKEKSSSIESNNKENKTSNTQMEEQLQKEFNEIKKQNEILTSRLNNCAKQFKVMMNTIANLKSEVAELKENKTSSKESKEEIKTINVDAKPTTASIEQDDTDSQSTVKEAVEAKKEVFLSPIEELNKTFNAEAIVEEFKKAFTDVKEAQAKKIELLNTFKKAGLNYYNRCELESRLSKYIKSLELINSTVQQEVPSEDVKEVEELPQEAIKEVKEVIESRKEDEATEGKESTFVETFQEDKSNNYASDEMLRYQDIKTKVYYRTLDAAQAANVNPMFLYDNEVGRCVSTFN